VKHTRKRASDVMRELDALAIRTDEGRCGACAEAATVFSPKRTR
jgi:hypothetical protein